MILLLYDRHRKAKARTAIVESEMIVGAVEDEAGVQGETVTIWRTKDLAIIKQCSDRQGSTMHLVRALE